MNCNLVALLKHRYVADDDKEVLCRFLSQMCNACQFLGLNPEIKLNNVRGRFNALVLPTSFPLLPVHVMRSDRKPLYVDTLHINAKDAILLFSLYHPLFSDDIVFLNVSHTLETEPSKESPYIVKNSTVNEASPYFVKYIVCTKEPFDITVFSELREQLKRNDAETWMSEILKETCKNNRRVLNSVIYRTLEALGSDLIDKYLVDDPLSIQPAYLPSCRYEDISFDANDWIIKVVNNMSWSRSHKRVRIGKPLLGGCISTDVLTLEKYSKYSKTNSVRVILGATAFNLNSENALSVLLLEEMLGLNQQESVLMVQQVLKLLMCNGIYQSEVAPSVTRNNAGKKKSNRSPDSVVVCTSNVMRNTLNAINDSRNKDAERIANTANKNKEKYWSVLKQYSKNARKVLQETSNDNRGAALDTHTRFHELYCKLRTCNSCKMVNKRSVCLDNIKLKWNAKNLRSLTIFNMLGVILENVAASDLIVKCTLNYFKHFNLSPPILLSDLCRIYSYSGDQKKHTLAEKFMLVEYGLYQCFQKEEEKNPQSHLISVQGYCSFKLREQCSKEGR